MSNTVLSLLEVAAIDRRQSHFSFDAVLDWMILCFLD